jgi:transcriptional regulator with XRE-family HTH domain
MRNPVRVTKRAIKKQNPIKVVGENLRDRREESNITQLQLAKAVTDILDVRRLITSYFNKIEPDYVIDEGVLLCIRQQILHIIEICNRIEPYFDQLEENWIRDAISRLLNVERLVGIRVERKRKDKGLVQRQLSEKIDAILAELGMAGPPNRAGISKVERGERRLDLLEACAVAIALNIELDTLLPPEIAVLLPRDNNPMKGWQPLTAWGNCRVYKNEMEPGVLTIATPDGHEVPDSAIELAKAYKNCQVA